MLELITGGWPQLLWDPKTLLIDDPDTVVAEIERFLATERRSRVGPAA